MDYSTFNSIAKSVWIAFLPHTSLSDHETVYSELYQKWRFLCFADRVVTGPRGMWTRSPPAPVSRRASVPCISLGIQQERSQRSNSNDVFYLRLVFFIYLHHETRSTTRVHCCAVTMYRSCFARTWEIRFYFSRSSFDAPTDWPKSINAVY